MSRADLRCNGINGGSHPFRVAASATRGYAGEPIMNTGSLSSGVSSVNTVVVLTDAKPVIGTDLFVGIAGEDMSVNSAGTVVAHELSVIVPIPWVTRIAGRAKTKTNADTDAELLGLMFDTVLFDLTTAVYTIDETAAADTSGLRVEGGNIAIGEIYVTVDGRSLRPDIS